MKSYYELLGLEPSAPADEIKRAFRREIAKYHPDKVQHLGVEFQEMAAGIAADLTEAYRILMDPPLRAKYDEDLRAQVDDPAGLRATTPAPRQNTAPPPYTPPSPPPEPPPARAPHSGTDLVQKAALARLRQAVAATLDADPIAVSGFDAAFASRPRKALFKKSEPGLCLLARVVGCVDAGAVGDVWPHALKANRPDASCVVLLMGSGLAPEADLAAAVSAHRRRSRGGGPVLVPVDVRDWEALFPPNTPGQVRALVDRLRAG